LDDLLILIDRLLVLVCFPYHSSVVQSTLDAFASGALFGVPSGASGIISLLRTLVKSFFSNFYRFGKLLKNCFFLSFTQFRKRLAFLP
jgi:hypothetical protein